jgi:hypothetical protein
MKIIAYVCCPFKSIGREWIWVMTASIFAAVLALWSIAGIPRLPYWAAYLVFLVSLCVAFVRSWNREHRKVLLLTREFVLPELARVLHAASVHVGSIGFSSKDAELNFYFEKIGAASRGIDRGLLREIIAISKQHKPIMAESAIQPRPRPSR